MNVNNADNTVASLQKQITHLQGQFSRRSWVCRPVVDQASLVVISWLILGTFDTCHVVHIMSSHRNVLIFKTNAVLIDSIIYIAQFPVVSVC